MELLGAAAIAPRAVVAQGAGMYGLISKLTIGPGKRDEFIAILKESTGGMPGCLSYIVAKDAVDENAIWITEAWDSAASHDASLALPAVKAAIAKGRSMIAGGEKVAVTVPVVGVGQRP